MVNKRMKFKYDSECGILSNLQVQFDDELSEDDPCKWYMITMSSMNIERFIAEVEKLNAEIKRLKHELVRNRALFMVCRDKILEQAPDNALLIISGIMGASYEKHEEAERELEALRRME